MFSFNQEECKFYIQIQDHWNAEIPGVFDAITKLRTLGHKVDYVHRRQPVKETFTDR